MGAQWPYSNVFVQFDCPDAAPENVEPSSEATHCFAIGGKHGLYDVADHAGSAEFETHDGALSADVEISGIFLCSSPGRVAEVRRFASTRQAVCGGSSCADVVEQNMSLTGCGGFAVAEAQPVLRGGGPFEAVGLSSVVSSPFAESGGGGLGGGGVGADTFDLAFDEAPKHVIACKAVSAGSHVENVRERLSDDLLIFAHIVFQVFAPRPPPPPPFHM